MARVVKADTEQRELVSRETTVKATDKITVIGTSTLLAGAIQQVCRRFQPGNEQPGGQYWWG
jgi:hypothetical protein